MSDLIAALPMYDWPEAGAEVDAQWAAIRGRLRAAGVDAPERLVRRNAEMPAVPGGIRDRDGRVIAPDPAKLPPDELDLQVLWRHPDLILCQTCWGPLETTDLGDHVRVIGQPSYDRIEGGQGEFYSSAIVMRQAVASPLRGGLSKGRGESEGAHVPSSLPPPRLDNFASRSRLADPPHKGEGKVAASIPLDLLRGKRLAYNEPHSMSGIIALTRDLEAIGEGLDIFSGRIETGGHRASVLAVAERRADVAAIDCRTWDLVKRFEPRAAEVQVVGWTARRKGLPFVTSRNISGELVDAIRRALDSGSG